jgi:hypothetical protein
LVLTWEEKTEGDSYRTKSFAIDTLQLILLIKNYWDDKIKKELIGGEYSTHL